jgi:uncharacterized membrane protein YqjE
MESVMKMSHRNKQYLFIACISSLATIIGIQVIMMVALEEPGRLIQIFGMCVLIISGIWQLRISRRAEEAESLAKTKGNK